jgi:hypothetical protein
MMERFKGMSPEEQDQFIARMKERGGDTSAFEAERAPKTRRPGAAPAMPTQATTIDALFAPLPVVETRGRAWLYVDKQLKMVNLRLGISDGTYTEVLSTELPETAEVVTGVTGVGTTRALPAQNNGNPLMPGRGPGGPGGGGGAGRGGRG